MTPDTEKYYMCIHSFRGTCGGISCGNSTPRTRKNNCCCMPLTKVKKYVRVTKDRQIYNYKKRGKHEQETEKTEFTGR